MKIFTLPTNFSKVSRKILAILTLLILQSSFLLAQDAPFITVWTTGTGNEITIPGTGTDYMIEWEEVRNEANNNGSETGSDRHTITFPNAGVYRVKISGNFSSVRFRSINPNKILEIEQWGDIVWQDLEWAFATCGSLEYSAVDAPDLSQVTSLSYMFAYTDSFNGSIGNWDVSNITDMSYMFREAASFNQDLSDWDVSNVTDMSHLFREAPSFNQDLSDWDVSNVENMSHMFDRASTFNGDITGWDVSSVQYANNMFNKARSFNGDIGNWNFSPLEVEYMFFDARSFNQDLLGWDVSNVTNMSTMFYAARAFNGDIKNWDVSNVTNMFRMFRSADAFNQDIGSWNVSNATNMAEMFENALVFNQNLGSWDVSRLLYANKMFSGADSFNGNISSWNFSPWEMKSMFSSAESFNQDISSWDVSNVTDMSDMFSSAKSFNSDLSGWNTSNVTDMSSMFSYASSFNQDLGDWDISKVKDMNSMLSESGLSVYTYDRLLTAWSALENLSSNVNLGASEIKYCYSEEAREQLINEKGWMISGDTKDCDTEFFTSIWKTDNEGGSEDNQITIPGIGTDYIVYWEDVENTETSGQETASYTHTLTLPQAGTYRVKIAGDLTRINFSDLGDKLKITEIENWGDIQWTSMNTAFAGAENLIITADDAPDLSQVTDMTRMFYKAKSLNQDISHWDVGTITNMSDLFHGASAFNQDLSAWDVSNVTKMTRMFASATSFNQDLTDWNTENVTDTDFMFWDADSFRGDISNWNVANVNNMWGMFYSADSMNTDISDWDVSAVTNMTEMFKEAAAFNEDISEWNVANVTDISGMFYDATSFDQNLGNWNLSNAGSLFEFLTNSGLSNANYDLTLEGWATNGSIPSNIALSAEGLFYCASEEYRQQLIDDYGWNITGDETCSLVLQETMPAAEATSVEKDATIYLTFDQEIEEIDLSGIALKDVSGKSISLTDIYIDSLTLHLVHDGLGSNTYQVTIPENSIISTSGKENEAISWSFATQRILSSKDKLTATDHSTYPNPFSDFTTIQFNLPQVQSVNVLVYDLKGRLVRNEQYHNLGAGNESVLFERKELPAGLYQYQIQSKGGSVGGKMLIK